MPLGRSTQHQTLEPVEPRHRIPLAGNEHAARPHTGHERNRQPPRRGDDWIYVFRNNRKDHQKWVEQGRPGFAEWKAHDQEIGAT